jgi:hypothetical protein
MALAKWTFLLSLGAGLISAAAWHGATPARAQGACTPKTCPAGAWTGGSFGWGWTYGLGGLWLGSEQFGDWYIGPGLREPAPFPAPRRGTPRPPPRDAGRRSAPLRVAPVDVGTRSGRPLQIEILGGNGVRPRLEPIRPRAPAKEPPPPLPPTRQQ